MKDTGGGGWLGIGGGGQQKVDAGKGVDGMSEADDDDDNVAAAKAAAIELGFTGAMSGSGLIPLGRGGGTAAPNRNPSN